MTESKPESLMDLVARLDEKYDGERPDPFVALVIREWPRLSAAIRELTKHMAFHGENGGGHFFGCSECERVLARLDDPTKKDVDTRGDG